MNLDKTFTFFLVRTRGNRPEMLISCLRSILVQKLPLKILVLNHSKKSLSLKNQFNRFELESIEIIKIDDLDAKRGHPLNIGFKLALNYTTESSKFLAIVDDDDIVYPHFLSILISESLRSQKTLVYGASFKKVDNNAPIPAFSYRPILELFVNNFIPINSYIVSLRNLAQRPIFFDEEMDVLEDWKFLLDLIIGKHEIGYVDTIVCEFSIRNDNSNSLNQSSVSQWEACEKQIETHIRQKHLEIDGEMLMEFGSYFKNNQERALLVPKHKLPVRKKSLPNRVIGNLKRKLMAFISA